MKSSNQIAGEHTQATVGLDFNDMSKIEQFEKNLSLRQFISIANNASKQAGDNPELHEFYFIEFLKQHEYNKRLGKQSY